MRRSRPGSTACRSRTRRAGSSSTSPRCRSSISHVAVMPDVHFGMGATVGSVIADQGRDHPGRGRRRHRLRHDGGAHHAHAPATCPTTSRTLRSGDRGGGAARRHRAQGRLEGRRAERGRRACSPTAAWPSGLEALEDEAPGHPQGAERRRTSARSAAATTSSRSASTRRSACGSCCTRARAASATASAPTSSSWRARTLERRQLTDAARPGPRLLRGRRAAASTTTSRRWAGRRTSRAHNREVMMAARAARACASSCRRSRCDEAGGQLPPQLRRARAPLRRGRAGDAQGRGARAAPASSASSRARMGAQVLHRARQGQRGELPVVLRTARAARCRAARPSGASRSPTTSRATAGRRVPQGRGVIDETPMAYKDIDAVMAAQRDLVEVVHTLRQVVCVKG